MADQNEKPPRNLAPFIIFGGMILIGASTMSAVLIARCSGDQNLMNPKMIRQPWQKPVKVEPAPAPQRDAGPAAATDDSATP